MVLNPGTSGTSENSWVQPKRKITQGLGTSLLWPHACKLRMSQLIRHSWVCVGWSSQGTMAFTVQAAMWETDLFMFSFMSFWGIKESCFFLYLNATESAGISSFLVPNTGELFQKLKSSDLSGTLSLWWWLFYSKSRRSRFSGGRGGRFQEIPRQSFAISPWNGEEEWDKARADGWQLHKGRVLTRGHVEGQCEFKAFANVSASIRDIYTIKIFHL